MKLYIKPTHTLSILFFSLVNMSSIPQHQITQKAITGPTHKKLVLIVAGSILGLLVLGGIAAVVYFLVLKPSGTFDDASEDETVTDIESQTPDESPDDAPDESPDKSPVKPSDDSGSPGSPIPDPTALASGALTVGEMVLLGGFVLGATASDADVSTTPGKVYLHVDASSMYMTSDKTKATPLKLVPTPGILDGYQASNGDIWELESYGLRDFGGGNIDAAGKVTLQDPVTKQYFSDLGATLVCVYNPDTATQAGLAVLQSYATPYKFNTTESPTPKTPLPDFGNPHVTGSLAKLTGDETAHIMPNQTYYIRPSFNYVPPDTVNACSGDLLGMKSIGDNKLALTSVDKLPPTFFFERA